MANQSRSGFGMDNATKQAMYRSREREKKFQAREMELAGDDVYFALYNDAAGSIGFPNRLVSADRARTLREFAAWLREKHSDELAGIQHGDQDGLMGNL